MDKELIKAYALENAIKHKGSAVSGAVLAGLFAEGLEKKNIKDVLPIIQSVLEDVNSMSLDEQKKEFEDYENKISKRDVREEGELPALEGAENGVVMRFAPFPSGPLHIGNTRQMILNDQYVKRYGGKLILVIDDTIGSEAKPIQKEAYGLIKEGANWLGINYDKKVILKSDRLEKYYSYAEELIKKDYMYVCSCSQEEIRKNRAEGVACSCREFGSADNFERWKMMFNAKPGDFVVRLKTSMDDPNPAFRDRIMFRISNREHPLVGNKYQVWPLLEFSWAIDDHLLGVTHIIRGIDLMMETKVEKFIWGIFGWPHPYVMHTGFFSIEGISLSKSKGSKEVLSGKYFGWNDPRTWSLQSLRDRGFHPNAIREFILNMGLTKSNSTIAVNVLYALNRKYLEGVPKFFFVPEPMKIKISGCPEFDVKIPSKKGVRFFHTTQEFYIPQQDSENITGQYDYRLMHLLNFRSFDISILDNRRFSFLSQEADKELEVKHIQWLPVNQNNIEVDVVMPDGSLSKGLGEEALLNLQVGDIIEFERFGFVRLNKLDKQNNKAIFWFAHK